MLNMLIWPPCNKCYKLQLIFTWIKLPGFFLKAQYMEHIKTHYLSLLQSRNDQAIQQRYPHLGFKSLNKYNLSNQLDQSNENT